nr:ROK family transcriptional regulator [Petrotoga sp. 9PWA.NaAc.5.4]
MNRLKILNYIYTHKEATKAEIAKKLGVSAPTVSRNLEPYINKLVINNGKTGSKLGRKADILEFSNENKIIGIQVENEFIIYGVYNLKQELLFSKKCFFKKFDCIDDLCNQLKESLKDIDKKENVLSTVLGISGYVSKDGFINSSALKINETNIKKVVETIKELFPKSLISFENDANLLAIKEKFYYGKDVKNIVCIYWGKGVGMGLIFGGELYVGKGQAGELGSIITYGDTLEKYIEKAQEEHIIAEWLKLLRNIYYVLQPDKIVMNCQHEKEINKIITRWKELYPDFKDVKIHKSEEISIVEGAAILAIELYLKKITVGIKGEVVY